MTGDRQTCVCNWGSSPDQTGSREKTGSEVGGALILNAQITVSELLCPARLYFPGISDPWPLGYNPQKTPVNTKFISLLKA